MGDVSGDWRSVPGGGGLGGGTRVRDVPAGRIATASTLRPLLEVTERIVAATGILNVWQELLAPELACAVGEDDAAGAAKARDYAKMYLGLRNYTRNLLNLGFTEQDISGEGSDRLIDAAVPHGRAASIAVRAREHLAAGANHVCLQAVGVSGVPRSEWTALAGALMRD